MIIREQEKIDTLRAAFAYTEREAKFLYLVAKHSGVFTTQQFCAYAQIRPGAASERFIDRVAYTFRNARMIYPRRGNQPAVYKLAAKFHGLLGRENATEPGRPCDVRTRLMCLDFIVSNPKQYLHSESEKMEHFAIHNDTVPRREYNGAAGRKLSYFPDNYPIAIGDRVEFVLVDRLSQDSLRRVVRSHRGLFAALGKCRVIFACLSAAQSAVALAAIERAISGCELDPEIISEFVERKRLESIPMAQLTQQESGTLARMRSSKASYWFERWKDEAGVSRSRDVEFASFVLPFAYDFLKQ